MRLERWFYSYPNRRRVCPVNAAVYTDLRNPILYEACEGYLQDMQQRFCRMWTPLLRKSSKYFLFTIPGNAGPRATLFSMVGFTSNHIHDPITRYTAEMDSRNYSTPRLPPPLSPPLWVAHWSIPRETLSFLSPNTVLKAL